MCWRAGDAASLNLQVWRLRGASTREHPAPFPLALAERLIRMFSFVGDTVLDPFAGTGTTGAAAAAWGRNSIGFEIDPHYVTLARERLFALASDMFAMRTVTLEDSAKNDLRDGARGRRVPLGRSQDPIRTQAA